MSEGELDVCITKPVYPGAKPESISLVINVCRLRWAIRPRSLITSFRCRYLPARRTIKDGDKKVWRDVVMPGINDYRTDAARTGQHAGTSEPEFGPDVTEKARRRKSRSRHGVGSQSSGAWPAARFRRILRDGTVEENHATKSSKIMEPNAMWKRRPMRSFPNA